MIAHEYDGVFFGGGCDENILKLDYDNGYITL